MKEIKTIKKINKILSFAFILAILIFTLYLILNFRLYIVATGSMQPTFQINELVVVKCSNEDTIYEVGDIITYYDADIDIDVTHRIVEINDNKIYTQGDYNNARDLNPTTSENIVGKVIWNSTFLGNLYVRYKFQILALMILIIVAVNVFFSEPKSKNKNDKN